MVRKDGENRLGMSGYVMCRIFHVTLQCAPRSPLQPWSLTFRGRSSKCSHNQPGNPAGAATSGLRSGAGVTTQDGKGRGTASGAASLLISKTSP